MSALEKPDIRTLGLQAMFPAFQPRTGDVVVDQFSTTAPDDQHKVDLGKPVAVCNPADKNGEDPLAPSNAAHLEGYKAKATKTDPPQPNFVKIVKTIQNQFGTLKLQVIKVDRLLVPSAKVLGNGGAPALGSTTLDHFECYKVKVAKAPKGTPPFPVFTPQTVAVTDEFRGPLSYDLKKPTRLCNPADKNGEDPSAPSHQGHLVCYQAKLSKQDPTPPKFQQPTVSTNNQFGQEVLDAKSVGDLCVPSLKLD